MLYNFFQIVFPQKRLHAIDSSELKPLSSVLDIADSSMKLQDADHPSIANNHHSLGRSIFLKRSRHHFGHHYSRRGSANLANPSSSRGKAILRDDKLSFKLAAQCNSELGRLAGFSFLTFHASILFFPFFISCIDLSLLYNGKLNQ